MPGRKHEAEQSRKRLRRGIAETIDSPLFRDYVRDLRDILRIDKAKRDYWVSKIVEHKKGLPAEKPVELPSGWRPFETKPMQSDIGEEVFWNRVRAVWMIQSRLSLGDKFTLILGQLMLAQEGIAVSEEFLLGALCHDFEGEERDAFIDHIEPLEVAVDIYYWYEPMAPSRPYSSWVEQNRMQPNRIYLDVTRASLSDVQACWPEVSELQDRFRVAKPKVGRPPGIEPRRAEVVRGKTWAETRAYLRNNPGEAQRLGHEYATEEKNRRRAKSRQPCSKQDEATWYSNAVRNFYKQVYYHPDMKGVKFPHAKRGRPRKGT
jgi:hypothetical protein